MQPPKADIENFLATQGALEFTHDCVGVTAKTDVPSSYHLDHNRVQLGIGSETFERAKLAIKEWKMFDFTWLQLCWPDAPIKVESTVAVLAKHLGFFSLHACRIVYVIDEALEDNGGISRFGFAYGTLPEHAECGEERFSIEFDHDTQAVTYDIYAISKPHQLLSKLGYPYTRKLQRKFAVDSMNAMSRAVERR